jgi:hypothetical protein
MKKIAIIFLSILCFSCSQSSKTEISSQNFTKDSINQIAEKTIKVEKDTLPLFDTTIYIKSEKQKVASPKTVSKQMVINDLYAYFKKKGYYLKYSVAKKSDNGEDIFVQEIDVPLDLEDYSELSCINSDTTMIYLADLNNDNQLDAIVEYYDFACYGSSHCNQPYKLIAINKKGKFIFQNEYIDFIPTSYSVDGIKTFQEEVIIYGNDYFCYDHKITGYFKIHLKHSN